MTPPCHDGYVLSERVIALCAAVEALAATDIGGCDRDDLDVVLARWRTVRSFTDAIEVAVARRCRELAAEGRSACAEDVLAQGGRRSAKDARAAAAREHACTKVSGFEQALADGRVSAGHLDALAAATHGLDDAAAAAFANHADALRRQAEHESVETFTRSCQDLARIVSADEGESRLERQRKANRIRQWVDRVTGMHHLHAELDPESGAKASSAINAAVRSMRASDLPDDRGREDREPSGRDVESWDQTAARALVQLLTGARSLDRRVPEVSVHIDIATLVNGLHEHSLCETGDGTMLPPSTVRRLCCEAEIMPVVFAGPSDLLDQGRAQRLASREQRRALRSLYRTCAWPGCSISFECCEVHHVVWWERSGRTDLDNLAPLCSQHHHLVHEGGWILTLAPGRTITLTRPDGTTHFVGTTTDRHPSGSHPPPGRRRSAA